MIYTHSMVYKGHLIMNTYSLQSPDEYNMEYYDAVEIVWFIMNNFWLVT